MAYFNFNGKVLEEKTNIVGPDNRGLRYGDGLFETIRYKNEQLVLADEHFARLWKGMNLLQFEIPKHLNSELLESDIFHLLKKNNHKNARIRLAVIRGNGGLYDPFNHNAQYIIQSWPLPDHTDQLNENGLQLCIYRDAQKSIDKFSTCKHNNYLPYFMGAMFAKEQHCNDAIILNQQLNICDTTIANIFIIKDGNISTPALQEGCVAGIMRSFIITELKKNKYPVVEKAISEDELMDADEVFLTNSIFNLRWVAGIKQKSYQHKLTTEIYSMLRRTNENIFC